MPLAVGASSSVGAKPSLASAASSRRPKTPLKESGRRRNASYRVARCGGDGTKPSSSGGSVLRSSTTGGRQRQRQQGCERRDVTPGRRRIGAGSAPFRAYPEAEATPEIENEGQARAPTPQSSSRRRGRRAISASRSARASGSKDEETIVGAFEKGERQRKKTPLRTLFSRSRSKTPTKNRTVREKKEAAAAVKASAASVPTYRRESAPLRRRGEESLRASVEARRREPHQQRVEGKRLSSQASVAARSKSAGRGASSDAARTSTPSAPLRSKSTGRSVAGARSVSAGASTYSVASSSRRVSRYRHSGRSAVGNSASASISVSARSAPPQGIEKSMKKSTMDKEIAGSARLAGMAGVSSSSVETGGGDASTADARLYSHDTDRSYEISDDNGGVGNKLRVGALSRHHFNTFPSSVAAESLSFGSTLDDDSFVEVGTGGGGSVGEVEGSGPMDYGADLDDGSLGSYDPYIGGRTKGTTVCLEVASSESRLHKRGKSTIGIPEGGVTGVGIHEEHRTSRLPTASGEEWKREVGVVAEKERLRAKGDKARMRRRSRMAGGQEHLSSSSPPNRGTGEKGGGGRRSPGATTAITAPSTDAEDRFPPVGGAGGRAQKQSTVNHFRNGSLGRFSSTKERANPTLTFFSDGSQDCSGRAHGGTRGGNGLSGDTPVPHLMSPGPVRANPAPSDVGSASDTSSFTPNKPKSSARKKTSSAERARRERNYWREVLAGRVVSCGPVHLRTAECLLALGNAHLGCKEYVEALSVFKSAVRIRRKILGNSNLPLARALDRVGYAACRASSESGYSQSNLDWGLVALMESLRIRNTLLGPLHPDTVGTMNNVAGVRLLRNELGEARGAYREVLAVRAAVFGASHPSVAVTASALGRVEVRLGEDPEGAVQYHELALQVYREGMRLDEDHPAIVKVQKEVEEANKMISSLGGF